MTKRMVYCICDNYNCGLEILAEPYSYCASCGCLLEPLDELANFGHIDDEELPNG